MRNLLICLIVITGIASLWTACSKTSADKLNGGIDSCVTANMGYAKDILPILQQYCFPCHGNGNTVFANGVNLQGSDNGYSEAQGILPNVTHAAGVDPMPAGKPQLGQCEINKIAAWLQQGNPHPLP
jgi:mono/diheme cytochrome c family protein